MGLGPGPYFCKLLKVLKVSTILTNLKVSKVENMAPVWFQFDYGLVPVGFQFASTFVYMVPVWFKFGSSLALFYKF